MRDKTATEERRFGDLESPKEVKWCRFEDEELDRMTMRSRFHMTKRSEAIRDFQRITESKNFVNTGNVKTWREGSL